MSSDSHRSARRGFTLIELLIAGVITAFVLGSISFSLRQIGRAKDTCKVRYDAFMRADTALNGIRRDIASIVRSDDLFNCRFLLIDNLARGRDESYERDELLMFTTRLRPLRNIEFAGEGQEYETHYRLEEDKVGPVLWQRRDPFPDEHPGGGGLAVPSVEGIIALSIQVYDGTTWYDDWDSDFDGLPLAVRVTVVSSGHRGKSDVYTAPRAILRTVVAIDRALSSKDWFITPPDEQVDEGAGVDADGDGIPDDQAPNPDDPGGNIPPPDGPPGPPPGPGGGPPGPRPGNGGPGPRPGPQDGPPGPRLLSAAGSGNGGRP